MKKNNHFFTKNQKKIGDLLLTKILVKIANKTQETMFIEVLPEIGVFLKDQLKNDFLSIQLEVDKNEVDKKPYTNTEKFRYLATKNENLDLLRRTLDLEI